MVASERRLTFAVAGLALGLSAAAPQSTPVTLADGNPLAHRNTAEALAAAEDRSARLTIPVMIDGKGPYPFVVDTGASRTVISRELAATLKLPAGPIVSMDDALGKMAVSTAIIDRLDVGSREISRIAAPVLAAVDLGADGMLGTDCLQDQLMVFDFHEKKVLVGRSAEDVDDLTFDTTVVRGRRRFGQLVLVDAESQTVPIFVILDSGAQNTIGNAALRRLMNFGPPRAGRPLSDTLISVSGSRTPAEVDTMPEIQLGGITIRNAPVAYATLHTFAQFSLEDRPALLLGMDVLRMFRRVSIDFRRKEAVFVTN